MIQGALFDLSLMTA